MSVETDLTFTPLLTGFPARLNYGIMGFSSVGLIRGQGKNILFDCGSHGSAQLLLNALAANGLAPEDIHMIVLSHLHFDHVGNLPMFPKAAILMNRKEWDQALSEPDEWVCQASVCYIQQKRSLCFVQDGDAFMDGFQIMELPGHTCGSIGVVLDLPQGKTVLTGDAIKNRFELHQDAQLHSVDINKSRNSIQKILSCAERLLPGHDCVLELSTPHTFPPVSCDLNFANGTSKQIFMK